MSENFEGKRGLIVDDDKSIEMTLRRILKDMGMQASYAPDVKSAKPMIAKTNFDVILSDMMMPGELGIDLWAHLKSVDPEQLKKFIIMSGGVHEKRAQELQDYIENMNKIGRFLRKPFDGDMVRAIVRDVLEGKLEVPTIEV